jgi:hypothetical protein
MQAIAGVMTRPHGAFAQDLRIEYRRSRALAKLGAVAHAGAVPCVLGSGVPGWVAAILVCLLALSFLAEYRSYRRDHGEAPLRYELDGADRWRCVRPDGSVANLAVCGDPFVHPWLVVLRLKEGRCVHVLVLTFDNCPPDVLRRLRVRLRYPLATPEPAQ